MFHGLTANDIASLDYRKFDGLSWSTFPITRGTLTASGSVVPYIDLVVQDNGAGDSDGLDNGIIADPGGLGSPS